MDKDQLRDIHRLIVSAYETLTEIRDSLNNESLENRLNFALLYLDRAIKYLRELLWRDEKQ